MSSEALIERATDLSGIQRHKVESLIENVELFRTTYGCRIIHVEPYSIDESGGGVRCFLDQDLASEKAAMPWQVVKGVVKDLSDEMAFKNLFFGRRGAKGGFYLAKGQSSEEGAAQFAAELCEAGWNAEFFSNPNSDVRDVLAPDVNTGPNEMVAMFKSIKAHLVGRLGYGETVADEIAQRVVASKPEEYGGMPDVRTPATGYLALYTAHRFIKSGLTVLGNDYRRDLNVVIRGNGNVGSHILKTETDRLGQHMKDGLIGGLALRGVSEAYGYVAARSGMTLDISEYDQFHNAYFRNNRQLDFSLLSTPIQHESVDVDAYLDNPDTDILVLASPYRDDLNDANVQRLIDSRQGKPTVIVEGGNGSISSGAELRQLEAGNFTIIPGEIDNSGGSRISNREVNSTPATRGSARGEFERLKYQQRIAVDRVIAFAHERGIRDLRAVVYALSLLDLEGAKMHKSKDAVMVKDHWLPKA